MATDKTEGFGEKVAEFFTQGPEDWDYEKAGGDSRVPQEERRGNPRQEARDYAEAHGEEDPYPEDGPHDQGDAAKQ